MVVVERGRWFPNLEVWPRGLDGIEVKALQISFRHMLEDDIRKLLPVPPYLLNIMDLMAKVVPKGASVHLSVIV